MLSTGRTLYHYNSATMTMREDGITDKQVEPFVEIAPEDASSLGVGEGDWLRLVSRRGDLQARAQLSDRVYPGLVWMALHFAEAKVNWLTHDVGDPLIGTPEYKVSRGAAGARLSSLAPAFAEPLLRGRFGRPYFYLEQCETTQRLLDAAQPEGAVAVCEEQTAGRGRHGPELGGAGRQLDPRLGPAAAAGRAAPGRADARRRRGDRGRRRARARGSRRS